MAGLERSVPVPRACGGATIRCACGRGVDSRAQPRRLVGSLSAQVFFIDTEGNFRPERIKQIAESMGVDSKAVVRPTASLRSD